MPIDWTTGALAEGIACFNRADYFDAHEHWEESWRASSGLERHLLQAHVQLAVALCHEQRGNRRGALGQLRKSLANLQHCPAILAGVQVERLRAEVQARIAYLEGPADATPPAVPVIAY